MANARRRPQVVILQLAAISVSGCLASDQPPRRVTAVDGPRVAAPVRASDWAYENRAGRRLVTPRYVLYTTLDRNDPLNDSLPQLLEGAYDQYRRLAPTAPPTDRPFECYVFADHAQWASYTRRHTGPLAPVYLQITRGGYTYGDVFAAFDYGERQTQLCAAHEGWHQFARRHFKAALPFFLEEGIACLFEDVDWNGRLPRWDLSSNGTRLAGLQTAADAKTLFPFPQLIRMHAGDVVARPGERLGAFYAQNWAFARFLWDAEGRRYRPALLAITADAVAGTIRTAAGTLPATGPWDRDASGPILEHYLRLPLGEIDRRFDAYVRQMLGKASLTDRDP